MTASLLAEIPPGAVVTVDAAPIIYFLQDHPDWSPIFAPVFEAAEKGELGIAISAITLTEVLTGPLKAGDEVAASRYREALTRSPGWMLYPVTEELAANAARFRAEFGLRTPDAIQVATAVASRSHALITSDKAFRKVRGITVLGMGRS